MSRTSLFLHIYIDYIEIIIALNRESRCNFRIFFLKNVYSRKPATMPAEDTTAEIDFKAKYEEYQKNGCVKIENFLTVDEVNEMKQELEKIVDNLPEDKARVFSAYEPSGDKETDEYYVKSGDKINFFFEKDAFGENGKLMMDKKEALNKIAHALHWWNPVFKKHTFSQKIKDLLRGFEYKDPAAVQSMVIFKKPKIGEEFKPHQDSTFLYTEPPSCVCMWMALEDATEENGCLSYVPGSHENGVHQRFVRNSEQGPRFIFDGQLPDYRDDQYVSVPAKMGDCVLIHGSVVHRSGKNSSDKARTAYTCHAIEKEASWSEANWVQPTEALPFPSIYAN